MGDVLHLPPRLSRERIDGAIDLLVRQGRAERVTIDGKPGVRLLPGSGRGEC